MLCWTAQLGFQVLCSVHELLLVPRVCEVLDSLTCICFSHTKHTTSGASASSIKLQNQQQQYIIIARLYRPM